MDSALKDILTRDRDKWRVTKRSANGGWIAYVPRYPHLVGRGATFAEAGEHLSRLIKDNLEGQSQ